MYKTDTIQKEAPLMTAEKHEKTHRKQTALGAAIGFLLFLWIGLYIHPARAFEQIPWTYDDGVLTVLEGITEIGWDSYWGERVWAESISPRVIVFPSTLQTIDPLFLEWAAEVDEYKVSPQSLYLQAIDGVVFSHDGSRLVLFPSARGGSYTVPEGVRSLAPGAFAGNNKLRELILCEGLASVQSLFEIRDFGVSYHPPLRRLVLPASLEEIDTGSLNGQFLEEIEAAAGNPLFISLDGVLFTTNGTLVAYPAGRKAAHYDVPAGTKTIGWFAFSHQPYIQSISLPVSVRLIESFAFYENPYLASISLPVTLESIEEYAFLNCVHLAGLSISPAASVENNAVFNCPLSGFIVDYQPPDYLEDMYTRRYGDVWAILSPENARDWVSVLESPNRKAGVTARYASGATVRIVGQEGNFYRIQAEELQKETSVFGYVPMEQVQFSGPLQGLFMPVEARLRAGIQVVKVHGGIWAAPADEEIKLPIYTDGRVRIDEQLGQWYRLWNGAYYSYVPTNQWVVYAREIPEGKTYGLVVNDDARDRLHLRDRPSRSGVSLGKFYSGTQVDILGEEGDWYQVRVGWQEGYMMKDYIQLVTAAP